MTGSKTWRVFARVSTAFRFCTKVAFWMYMYDAGLAARMLRMYVVICTEQVLYYKW